MGAGTLGFIAASATLLYVSSKGEKETTVTAPAQQVGAPRAGVFIDAGAGRHERREGQANQDRTRPSKLDEVIIFGAEATDKARKLEARGCQGRGGLGNFVLTVAHEVVG